MRQFGSARDLIEQQGSIMSAVERQPASALAQYNVGYYFLHIGPDYQSAATHFRRAIELRPRWALAHHGLAKAYFGLNQFRTAIDEAVEALRLEPEFFEPALLIAWCHNRLSYTKKSTVDEALRASLHASSIAKTADARIAANLNVRNFCMELKQLEGEARARREMVLSMRPFYGLVELTGYDLPKEAFLLADVYRKLGDPEKMVWAYRQAASVKPLQQLALMSQLLLAEHLRDTGRFGESEAEYLGLLRLVEGANSEAGAKRMKVNRDSYRFWRGAALAGLGRDREALEDLRAAVRGRPSWNEARLRYGYLLVKMNRVDEGIREVRRSGLATEAEIKNLRETRRP
jgi:tetratricopeptide (TPR) repeat protein